jgi:hypothetical protein
MARRADRLYAVEGFLQVGNFVSPLLLVLLEVCLFGQLRKVIFS